MPTDLRPLSLGELLDRAFTLYRRHFRLLVGITAVPSAFGLVIALCVVSLQYQLGGAVAGPPAGPPTAEMLIGIAVLFAGTAVLGLASLVVHMIALGAITRAVSELYFDRAITIGGVYRSLRSQAGALVVLLILLLLRVGGLGFVGVVFTTICSGVIAVLLSPFVSGLVLLAGFTVTAAICVFMMLRYGVAVPALVVERLTAGDAIRRSIRLTDGHRWRVLVLVVCALVVSSAALGLLQWPFLIGAMMAGPETRRALVFNLIGTVTGAIGGTLTGPIMITCLALLYYDTRVRHEALDLDVMIDALDRRTAQPPLEAWRP